MIIAVLHCSLDAWGQSVLSSSWSLLMSLTSLLPALRFARYALPHRVVSRVSFDDYARALVDALEKPAHARFTIGDGVAQS